MASVNLFSQAPNNIGIERAELIQVDNNLEITFGFSAGKKAAKKNYSLFVVPILNNGNNNLRLTPIIVQGKNAKISEERHLISGKTQNNNSPMYVHNGEKIVYHTTVPYMEWMNNSQLTFEGLNIGCCSATEVPFDLGFQNLNIVQPNNRDQSANNTNSNKITNNLISNNNLPVSEDKIENLTPKENIKKTFSMVGEELADKFSYVIPYIPPQGINKYAVINKQFDYNMPLAIGGTQSISYQDQKIMPEDNVIYDNYTGALNIEFTASSKEIDRSYQENNKALVDLISVIRAIENSHDTKIVKITITGFTSPDAAQEVYERLSWDRSVNVKKFILANTKLEAKVIEPHNGAVDWKRLKDMVAESDLFDKHRIINIIENSAVQDSKQQSNRHVQLMKLNSGKEYQYMKQHFFPKLRNTVYVNIYYESAHPSSLV